MFGFSNKKKENEINKEDSSNSLKNEQDKSVPSFNNNFSNNGADNNFGNTKFGDLTPPPPKGDFKKEEFKSSDENVVNSQSDAQSFQEGSNQSNTQDIQLNQDTQKNSDSDDGSESDDVSFEIPDFTEEDIDLNINMSDLDTKNEDSSKEGNQDIGNLNESSLDNEGNQSSTFNNSSNSSESDSLFNSQSSGEDVDWGQDVVESDDVDSSDDEENLQDEGDVQAPADPADSADSADSENSDFVEDTVESDDNSGGEVGFEADDGGFGDDVESGENDVESGEEEGLPQFGSGGEVGFEADDNVESEGGEDLPQFEVSQSKFISKADYKDLIMLLMNIDEVSKNLLKQESEFLKIESDLAKDSLSIEKDVSLFKEYLIKIDRTLFNV